jgi:hypothetical protein
MLPGCLHVEGEVRLLQDMPCMYMHAFRQYICYYLFQKTAQSEACQKAEHVQAPWLPVYWRIACLLDGLLTVQVLDRRLAQWPLRNRGQAPCAEKQGTVCLRMSTQLRWVPRLAA